MATMNLYLPDTLRAEMDGIEGVNWSSLAQDAFRAAVIERKARGTMDKQAIAERIRTTSGANSTKYKEGKEEGRRWAAEEADADQLEALDGLDIGELWANVPALERPAQWVARCIADELGADGDAETIFGDVKLNESYVDGWVEGACELYGEVKPLI